MDTEKGYYLVHLTSGGEYKTPLVASQLFDQAEFQGATKNGFAPGKTEAWVIGSMREYFDKNVKRKINALKKRCPHIAIYMMNGIGRLRNFPVWPLLFLHRLQLGKKVPVIYHCRGESVAKWALRLKAAFPDDKVVLDVRGYWPAELLYARGIDDPALAKGRDFVDFNNAYKYLKEIIHEVDGVTTVSAALKELLIKEMAAPEQTSVVPCCISQISNDEKRLEIRREWGIADDEIAVVYSGSTAAYQHLEDLTIPFLKKLAETNNKIRLIFLSSEAGKIKKMLAEAGIEISRVIVRSYPQNEVAMALTACDAGILIRKPTLVNQVANPVKIAEYLAAGLPVIIEKGVGGISETLFEQSLFKGIEITGASGNIGNIVSDVNEWLNNGLTNKRTLVRDYARSVYLWSAAIHVSREMYKEVLKKK